MQPRGYHRFAVLRPSGKQWRTGRHHGCTEAGRHRGRLDLPVPSTSTEAELHDLTQHAYLYSTSTDNAGATTVFIGAQANPLHNLDTFTKAVVANATLNGDYLGFESPTRYNYTQFGTNRR